MSAEEFLRLAWHADRDGRPGMRDALLTLAAAESGPTDEVLAERCRKRLVAGRPEHWFAAFPTVGEALAHPKVAWALGELRASYPEVRVRRLLLRGEARLGPYTKRPRSLSRVVDDLVGGSDRPRRGAAGASDAPVEDVPALPFPVASDEEPTAASVTVFYLTILLAIAILLNTVLKPSAQDTKAA
jgi:hypothetical protein